jgi:hypothetical protein
MQFCMVLPKISFAMRQAQDYKPLRFAVVQ